MTAASGVRAAADWLTGPDAPPLALAGDGRLTGPLLVVCEVAATAAGATLCGFGSVDSGARLVRVLGHESAEGPAADWFADEAVRRAGAAAGANVVGALERALDTAGNSLTEILKLVTGEHPPLARSATALKFGQEGEYKLTATDLLDGFDQVGSTMGAAVRALLTHRADLLRGPATASLEVLAVGRLAVLPWVGGAGKEAAERWLVETGLPASGPVRLHNPPAEPGRSADRGAAVMRAGRVLVSERCEHTVRLRTHQVVDGQLRADSLTVATAGGDWPDQSQAGAETMVVQVDGSQGSELTLEVERAGRRTTGRARLAATDSLSAGRYHIGLRPGREPAGALVLAPVNGGEPHLLEIVNQPES
jgi:hypothetical protein